MWSREALDDPGALVITCRRVSGYGVLCLRDFGRSLFLPRLFVMHAQRPDYGDDGDGGDAGRTRLAGERISLLSSSSSFSSLFSLLSCPPPSLSLLLSSPRCLQSPCRTGSTMAWPARSQPSRTWPSPRRTTTTTTATRRRRRATGPARAEAERKKPSAGDEERRGREREKEEIRAELADAHRPRQTRFFRPSGRTGESVRDRKSERGEKVSTEAEAEEAEKKDSRSNPGDDGRRESYGLKCSAGRRA